MRAHKRYLPAKSNITYVELSDFFYAQVIGALKNGHLFLRAAQSFNDLKFLPAPIDGLFFTWEIVYETFSGKRKDPQFMLKVNAQDEHAQHWIDYAKAVKLAKQHDVRVSDIIHDFNYRRENTKKINIETEQERLENEIKKLNLFSLELVKNASVPYLIMGADSGLGREVENVYPGIFNRAQWIRNIAIKYNIKIATGTNFIEQARIIALSSDFEEEADEKLTEILNDFCQFALNETGISYEPEIAVNFVINHLINNK
jgi:hypothetical protein